MKTILFIPLKYQRKYRKRKIQNTGSQTDEDCETGHCCETSARNTKFEAKIDKLLGLFFELTSLKECVTEVEEVNKILKKAAENTEKELKDRKTCVVNLSSLSVADSSEREKQDKEIQQLKCRNIRLEAYTRKGKYQDFYFFRS